MFPDTPQTLLRKISELATGDDAAEWAAFVELYTPPLTNFIGTVSPGLSAADVEDAVEEVMVRLVEVLRSGRIDRSRARFRAYLSAMARRLLIDRYRESLVRPALPKDELPPKTVDDADPGTIFDLRWRVSVHEAAIRHVLTKTAVSEQSKAIYLALQGIPGEFAALTPRQIAARFGVTYAALKQVKSRLDRAVAAVERRMSE